jgi:hypothetical protein
MLHVSTKEALVCHTFVNVKFNWVLGFVGPVKIRGFDTFEM